MNRYYQLTLEQRYQISALKETGLKQKEIAIRLGVDPSTISRELKRNSSADRYDPQVAHTRSDRRRRAAAYSGHFGHRFRLIPATRFGFIRPPISADFGHPH